MRLMRAPVIASVLLTLMAPPPGAWGADGIDVIKAGREDIGAFDNMLSKSRSKDAQNARAAARSAVGSKVSAEARKVRDEHERDIQETKNFGQWVKSTNNPAGGKGSAAAVGDDDGNGSGGDGSSKSARDKTDGDHKKDSGGHGSH